MAENVNVDAGPEPSGPPPTGPPVSRRLLRRGRDDRKIAGVCGGLGRYTDIDPLIFRVVVVVLAVIGGSGLLLYALGWLLIPEEDDDESEAQRLLKGRGTPLGVAVALLGLAGIAAFGSLLGTDFGFGGVVTLAVLAVVIGLISRSSPRTGPGHPRGSADVPEAATGVVAHPPQPTSGQASGFADAPPGLRPPARDGSPLGQIVVSVALLTAGVLVAVDTASSVDISVAAVLAVCLAVVGTGLLVSAFVGRARGLIVLGVGLLVAMAGAAAADTYAPLRDSAGDRYWAPTTMAEVESPYRLSAGTAQLDLTEVVVPAGETLRVAASVGAGELIVRVPSDVALDVEARSRIGNIEMPDFTGPGGINSRDHYTDDGAGTAGLIVLDLELGVGDLEVHREAS